MKRVTSASAFIPAAIILVAANGVQSAGPSSSVSAAGTASAGAASPLPPSKGPAASNGVSASASSSKPNNAVGTSANIGLQGSIGALAIAVCGLTYF
ncbi:hypothetical protein LPJ57_004084 [Coemansia sp. RSA 486]|nr:hypothetical protein LPJ57_004084 [Coemansia sp. RSA 486]KAJ2237063.1 hypothetical protein IWW45_001290 [Coemansia sp. RSA 485]